ncbi:MAG: response regulator transcription factor [Candidatus Micrarchaeia archaeon]|jgi:DNA-binding NarL/FixJ family response regulator
MKKNEASVLIIDDEADVRKSIALLLAASGFSNVDDACGAAEGVKKASAKDYDIILLDMIMPKVSGWGALEKISAKKIRTRVLVLSAVGLPEVVKEEIKMRYPGVGFLPKTLAAAELPDRMREMLKLPAGEI